MGNDNLRDEWINAIKKLNPRIADLHREAPQFEYSNWRIAVEKVSNFRSVVFRWIGPKDSEPKLPTEWCSSPSDRKKSWPYRVKVAISEFPELLEKLVQYEKHLPIKEKDIPPPTEHSIINGNESIKKDILSNGELIKEDNQHIHKIFYNATNSLPEKRKSISEKEMEDAIVANPEKYLGESSLKLVARQYRIGNYIFDLLFEDRHGAKLIVEIQRGTLDRNHTYKILDYYDEYKDNNPKEFVDLMIIANIVPRERQARLRSKGIEYKEIPLNFFLED